MVQRPRQGKYSPTPERDVDLVVCLGVDAIPAVWRLFADQDEPPTARRSVSDAMGEIDIVLTWSDLAAQPNWAFRSRLRTLPPAFLGRMSMVSHWRGSL